MGLNGYTVCSGVISHELNGPGIISIPLDVDEYMEIGIITRKNTTLTRYGRGLYRRDSSAYLGCCAPHGFKVSFMTVQTDIGNIYIKLL